MNVEHTDNDTFENSRANIDVSNNDSLVALPAGPIADKPILSGTTVRNTKKLESTFTVFSGIPDSARHPVTGKAMKVPLLNVKDRFGRQFWLATMGFMLAFMAWYSFVPLLTKTIRKDLGMTQDDVANSNILGLTATLVVRIIVGPLCDKYGARLVFIYLLFIGSIPVFLGGTSTTPADLIAIRFFVGILGGTFVPCQVWTTGFFDSSVVGTANAFAAGIGNAGGGICYFVMPAIVDGLVKHMSESKAWRVSFVIPSGLIVVTAFVMLVFGQDTPNGRWSDRKKTTEVSVGHDGITKDSNITIVETDPDNEVVRAEAKKGLQEVVKDPTWADALSIVMAPQTLALSIAYASTFGGELAINSILGAYYAKNLQMGQTMSGRWAAMFGLLNVFFRPLGGYLSDKLYHRFSESVVAKKAWLTALTIGSGVFCILIGAIDPKSPSVMIGLVAALAFCMDAANGANFGLVPHVFPSANGVVAGVVGAAGNLGGILGAVIFRVNGTHYGRAVWIIGAAIVVGNVAVAWISPLPAVRVKRAVDEGEDSSS